MLNLYNGHFGHFSSLQSAVFPPVRCCCSACSRLLVPHFLWLVSFALATAYICFSLCAGCAALFLSRQTPSHSQLYMHSRPQIKTLRPVLAAIAALYLRPAHNSFCKHTQESAFYLTPRPIYQCIGIRLFFFLQSSSDLMPMTSI